MENLQMTDPAPVARRRRLRVLALPAFKRRKLNPFQALLYDEMLPLEVEVKDWTFFGALWQRCDIWHLHHPDTVLFPRALWHSFLETVLLRCLLSWAKVRGIKILWTVHDLDSSDNAQPHLERWFWHYFLPRLDGYICLTTAGKQLACQRFPALAKLPGFITAHGDFRPAYPRTLSKHEAREALELPDGVPVLLNFGLIRPYKGVPELIDAMRNLPVDNAILLIAGRVFDASVEQEIMAHAQERANIRLHLKWIAFEDTQRYFMAADLVVLPYRRILNSGTLMLALAFDRPVLVPDLGTMRELQERFGTQWLRIYKGDLDSTELSEAIDWATQTPRPALDLTGLDWPNLAQQTRSIYDSILDPSSLPLSKQEWTS